MAMENYSKLRLEFDQITGAMKLAGQESVSLQKQVRLLKQELTLGSYTDQQFKQIQGALQETEIKLKQSQLRGKDLFEQIQTTGGAFGEFSGRIDRTIKLLNAFANTSFDELKNQFKVLFAQITGDVEGISSSIESVQSGGRPSGLPESSGSASAKDLIRGGAAGVAGGIAGAAGAKAYSAPVPGVVDMAKQAIETERETKALKEQLEVNKKLILQAENYNDLLSKTATLNNERHLRILEEANDLKVNNAAYANMTRGQIWQQLSLKEEEQKRAEFQQKYAKASKTERDRLYKDYQTEQVLIQNLNQSYKTQEQVTLEMASLDKYLIQTQQSLEQQFQDTTFVIKENSLWIGYNDLELRKLTEAEMATIFANEKLILTNEGLITSEETLAAATSLTKTEVLGYNLGVKLATAANWLYTGSVRVLAAAFGVDFVAALQFADKAVKVFGYTLSIVTGAFLAIQFAQFIGYLYQTATGFAKMQAEAEQAGRELSNISTLLDMDLKDAKRRGAERVAQMKKDNATSEEIRKEELKNAKDNYNANYVAYTDALEAQRKAQQASQREEGLFGVDSETAKIQAENVKKAGDLVLKTQSELKDAENDIIVKKNANIEATTKEGINNRLKAIDAEMEQQIESTKTSSKELLRLYKERNQLADYLDKDHHLTSIELAERTRIQNKKINDAIIEDNVRVIQAEIDKNQRLVDESGKGTEQEFKAKREVVQQMFNKEMEEAKKDEKTRLNNEKNARTKFYKESKQIDIDELTAKENLAKHYLDAESENTELFFQLERQLEDAAYAKQQAEAKGNYDMLEALRLEHLKKMELIDAKELENRAQMLERKSKTEFQDEKNKDDYTIKSLFTKHNVLRDINEKAYQDQVASEDAHYEAEKIKAGTNKEALTQIELEHLQVLRDLGAQKIETEQQVNLMIEQLGVQFGSTLSNIGNVLLQDAQGRDEKKFKAAKKMAVAGIGIEKAAAIASIWTNNYIANGKARATFWATGGQPFVTINTISAILNTAATVAAAAQAMSAINGTDFQSPDKGSGRHYASGGYINGPRHSNGGVPIEVEGGEAVMTRGAVTAFSPLLSMLNVAGGGTSFSQGAVGQAGFDNPVRDGQQYQQAQITKTYVVEQELTTMQQRQARLKNLSTL